MIDGKILKLSGKLRTQSLFPVHNKLGMAVDKNFGQQNFIMNSLRAL